MSSEATRIRQQELTNLRTELDIERERGLHRQRLLEEGEDERRRMHNIIQELRGSVRVFVRARPFLKADGEDAAEQVYRWRFFCCCIWCRGEFQGSTVLKRIPQSYVARTILSRNIITACILISNLNGNYSSGQQCGSTDPLKRKSSTRNIAYHFRENKKFWSGYTGVSVGDTHSQIRNVS